MLNADVLAPMPSPSVTMAIRAKPGERRSDLMANRKSPRMAVGSFISMLRLQRSRQALPLGKRADCILRAVNRAGRSWEAMSHWRDASSAAHAPAEARIEERRRDRGKH